MENLYLSHAWETQSATAMYVHTLNSHTDRSVTFGSQCTRFWCGRPKKKQVFRSSAVVNKWHGSLRGESKWVLVVTERPSSLGYYEQSQNHSGKHLISSELLCQKPEYRHLGKIGLTYSSINLMTFLQEGEGNGVQLLCSRKVAIALYIAKCCTKPHQFSTQLQQFHTSTDFSHA